MSSLEKEPSLLSEGNYSTDDNDSVEGCTPHDVLLELYLFVQNKKDAETCRWSHVMACLEEEGVWFWRDRRFRPSQQVVVRLLLERESSSSLSKEHVEQLETFRKSDNIPLSSQNLHQAAQGMPLDYAAFVQIVSPCAQLFLKAFNEEMAIPDWTSLVADVQTLFGQTAPNQTGQTAQYIPILKNANPEQWGLSLCSIDGQRLSLGDATVSFSLQSVSKPVTYAMGLAKEGETFMEEWIDVEPAGRPFNTQDLDPATNRPFNASINSGAIMAAGVVASGYPESMSWREIVRQIQAKWSELCGNDMEIGFSEETFHSEKETAYNNFAIAYNLKGRRGLPRDVDLHKMLDVYLGCCSMEITAEALSVAAATLANGGICPITGVEVFPAQVVRSVLAETMCCGMYDQAGRFAVEVGLPAKSGVSGAIMVIVPNVFGFATFSPRLNAKGNSVRGYEFCKRLVQCYRLHVFEPSRSGNTGAKIDPRRNGWKEEKTGITHLAWAASVGDESALKIRDIFLYVLVRIAMVSREGLSERKLKIIKEQYETLFLVHLKDELLERIKADTKKHLSENDYWVKLYHGVQIADSIKKIMFQAMNEVLQVDGHVNEEERKVALSVASLLGVVEGVAKLEINRFEHHVGHRFENVERPGTMIQEVSASVHGLGSRHSRSIPPSRILPLERVDPVTDPTRQQRTEDVFALRKKIVKLGKKFSSLTKVVGRKPKYTGYYE